MKKFLLFIACLLTLPTWAQEDRVVKPLILPGKGHINVEKLNGKIDTNMDISQLSLSELRVLRNAFAAQQGYAFKAGELRAVFETTSWYHDRMWDKFAKEDADNTTIPLKYTPAQQAFIDKLQAREKELLADNGNFSPPKRIYRVNIENLINPYQLEEIDPKLMDMLGKNGFAIVPDQKIQLFHIYEKNDYSNFPSFVTTDLYLQLFHLYFDSVLRSIEEEKLSGVVISLCQQLYDAMGQIAKTTQNAEVKAAAEYDQAFAAIGLALATGNKLKPVADAYKKMAEAEVQKAMNSENDYSEFLEYNNVMFAYALFRPRGHYTRSETVKKYFRAMMWLQTAPFHADNDRQLKRMALMAETICKNPKIRKTYDRINTPITYMMGEPDNVTALQVYQQMNGKSTSIDKLFADKKAMDALSKKLIELAGQQIRIRPKFENTSPYKINLMPQRYQLDGEVLNEMVDAVNSPTKRGAPMGLDVFAAMGCTKAEQILTDELGQDKQWKGFMPTLKKMKDRMKEINWKATLCNQWLDALQTMNQTKTNVPYFMLGEPWKKKDLNAGLASWAELKHDAILYAKQPVIAECGDYGPPEPVVKGYVEPNVAFWQKAIDLMDATTELLGRFDLMTEKARTTTERVKEQAEFFLSASKKELRGEELSDEEYNAIEIIGSTFENISLSLVSEKDQHLMGWDDVTSADKSVAIVADVCTANGFNNPKPCVLYEGVGTADEIYVVVEIKGYLYLMRGAVLSYREFDRPVQEQRLTDEEWQEMLKTYPTRGVPSWMDEITVPLKKLPEDNEEVFYSSGC